MSIFNHSDYRPYIQERRERLPKKGWGFVRQLAEHLGLNSVQVSQVLGGGKDFTLEQGLQIASFLDLTSLEKDYFLWLIIRSRAGSKALVQEADNHLQALRAQSAALDSQVPPDKSLNDKEYARFYSHYLYSAVRLFASLEGGKSLEEVMDYFKIGRVRALSILEFLAKAGLCELHKGRYRMTTQRTHVGRNSPHLARHHLNWRMVGLQTMDLLRPDETMMTSTVSISRKDFDRIQKKMAEMIKEISQIIRDSPPEILACWNADWFEMKF